VRRIQDRHCHHNHGRKDKTYGTVEQLEQALAQTSDRIGLCLDAAWLLDVSADPVETLRKFADRVYGVHLKDFTFDADGTRHEHVIGTGGLRLWVFLDLLVKSGFAGYVSIQYEADAQNPLNGIRPCVEEIKKARHPKVSIELCMVIALPNDDHQSNAEVSDPVKSKYPHIDTKRVVVDIKADKLQEMLAQGTYPDLILTSSNIMDGRGCENA
jgi:hypothetical protein